MVFGKFKNYPIFRYIIYDFLKKVSRGSRPTCLAKILCAVPEHGITMAWGQPAIGQREWTLGFFFRCQGLFFSLFFSIHASKAFCENGNFKEIKGLH